MLGNIQNWTKEKRTQVSARITLAATGPRAEDSSKSSNPCFTIADAGEGQTPDQMPLTLLSLDKKNKFKVQFVQGKFNMGGTGVLRFCGQHNLQFILSRRNPAILIDKTSIPQNMWGFTIVRRENPTQGERSSVYTYLAPVGAEGKPRKGDVLRFLADKLPIFPEGQEAYKREAQWGTAIKMYEYSSSGFRTMMFRKDGLLSRLDVLLPGAALPIRLYECRDYKGHPGSFETTLSGLVVRLEDNKNENLEEGFPSSFPFAAQGQAMNGRIYAFKPGKANTYRKSEGIIFTINGQTHGYLGTTFFARKTVGMGRLDDSILVVVDCSHLDGRAREDLFMNSRDRLVNGELRAAIEEELESVIRDHPGLKALREKRKREEIESKLSDSKPLVQALESILKSSPSLLALFGFGNKLSNPFKAKEVDTGENIAYKGKYTPTYFKFSKIPYGQKLERTAAINMRSRITFETDAANEYFSRAQSPGVFRLSQGGTANKSPVTDFSLNLHNGKATLSAKLPQNTAVGDLLIYEAEVHDETGLKPFLNEFHLKVIPVQPLIGGGGNSGNIGYPPKDKTGDKRELPTGIAMPEIHEVKEEDWGKRKHEFDKYSALEIVQEKAIQPEESENGSAEYSFWINVDNIYLKTECKASKESTEVIKARWLFGLTLVGMALIQSGLGDEQALNAAESVDTKEEACSPSLEDHVFATTSAIGSVLLPMLTTLGSLSEQDTIARSESSE